VPLQVARKRAAGASQDRLFRTISVSGQLRQVAKLAVIQCVAGALARAARSAASMSQRFAGLVARVLRQKCH